MSSRHLFVHVKGELGGIYVRTHMYVCRCDNAVGEGEPPVTVVNKIRGINMNLSGLGGGSGGGGSTWISGRR